MHKLIFISRGLILAALPTLLAGQAGVLDTPAFGYVPDGPAVRAFRGIPGASLLGPRLPLGFEISAAQVSPRQDYLLAVARDTGAVSIVELGGAALVARELEGTTFPPSRIVLSPSGSAALLVSGDRRLAQVLTGLPAQPAAAGIDISGLPEPPGALAVSDDGTTVLAATSVGLFAVTDGKARALPSTGTISALAFTPGATDALAAGPGHVSAIRALEEWRTVASLPEDAGTPLAVTAARRGALVAFGGSAMAVDMATGATATLPCAGVTGLFPLGNELFRLNEVSAGPLWLVDGGGAVPRLLFVAPAAGEETR